MASEEQMSSSEKRFLDEVQQYYNQLASEAKKKHPPVKEAAETGIIRIRNASSKRMLAAMGLNSALLAESPQLLEPFFMGCDTRTPKMVLISINAIQKFIIFECVNPMASSNLLTCLWNLMEHGIEEVRILQTITLLLTTNQLITDEQLARTILLCFRLHYTKNSTTSNTASAAIRQLITVVFERVQNEDKTSSDTTVEEEKKLFQIESADCDSCRYRPTKLKPAALDAFNFIQDLIQLINGEKPFWLNGNVEVTKTFGLELLELIFDQFSDVFHKHEEFKFLLKEKVCQLVIKLFSPNIKQRGQFLLNPLLKSTSVASNQSSSSNTSSSANASSVSTSNAQASPSSAQTPFWSITVRLMRIVSVLIRNFFEILVTESEIFFSLLVKLLEMDKSNWQRSIALEALFKMIQPDLISSLCKYYDMNPASSKILRDIINALCIYIQSQFRVIDSSSTQSLIASLVNNNNGGGATPSFINNGNNRNSNSYFPVFNLRGVSISLLFTPFDKEHQYRTFYIDQLEKTEPPNAPEGHGLSTALVCVFEIVNTMVKIIENDLKTQFETSGSVSEKNHKISTEKIEPQTKELHMSMLNSTFCGFAGTFSLLLDASSDEAITELILEHMRKLVSLYGLYGLDVARDSLLISMCKSSFPSSYYSIEALNPYNLDFDESILPKANSDLLPNSSSINLMLNHSITNAAINLPNLLSQQNRKSTTGNNNGNNSLNTNVSSLDNNGSASGNDLGLQIIAVGTPLPTANTPTANSQQQGAVMLTSKNLQCMNSILKVSISFGYVYDVKSWHIVLTTLQHLVWILNLKPNQTGVYHLGQQNKTSSNYPSQQSPTGGQQDGSTPTSAPATVITTAAMSDLPVLTTMLSRLFECTQHLDDDALLRLIKALITLSNESLEVAYNNREPSLFPVVKLLEMGLVNLQRIDLIWGLLVSHLVDVSSHPYFKLREWGVDVLCNLIKSVLTSLSAVSETKSSQAHYLEALRSLSEIKFVDIRQKQIECTLQLLQTSGEYFTDGWPVLFAVIESACAPQNENLTRCAFQCYQFIISDLLAHIPAIYLIHCINAAVTFGSQLQELNVSLTAIGLIWNVSDFLHSNQEKLQISLDEYGKNGHTFINIDLPFCEDLSPFQSLWISLFKNLSNLCTDARLSVRKSSGQTLFSTLSTHGSILDYNTWKAIFFYVLFPLIDSVRTLCGMASNERITHSESSMNKSNSYGDNSEYIIHYSRNTAFKQWCETQVLVLNGISRLVCLKLELLVQHSLQEVATTTDGGDAAALNDSETLLLNVWSLFFEFIYTSAISNNTEVSISAMKCFNEIVIFLNDFPRISKDLPASPLKITQTISPVWSIVWKSWCNIGHNVGVNKIEARQPGGQPNAAAAPAEATNQVIISSQPFLCLLIKPIFVVLSKIINQFSESDFKNLSYVLQNAISTPFINEPSLYNYGPSDQALTQLQTEVITLLESLQEQIITNLATLNHLLPLMFYQYLTFSLYAVNIIPPHLNIFITTQFQHRFLPGELTSFNTTSYYVFGERALKNAFNMYLCTHKENIVIKSHILHSLIKAYKTPLCFKYSCPLASTWKHTVNYFVKTLELGLALARKFPNDFISIWADLALTFEGFLFPVNKPPTNQTMEEQQIDESLDVKVVELIRDHIMIYAQQIPKEFLLQIVSILNRGSIHSPSITSPIEAEINRKLREDFARVCFQTLLQFSFFGPKGNPDLFIQSKNNLADKSPEQSIGIVNKLAVASILKRFNDVIVKYVEDEQLCPCPLPRHRLSEISFVLKALATLILSLKEAPADSVEVSVWKQLIDLYPKIVDCTMSNSPQVNNSIREVLHEYAYLLACPKVATELSKPETNGDHIGAVSSKTCITKTKPYLPNGSNEINI